MMVREGEQCTVMSGENEVDRSLRPAEAQECSMCGDVGFANQLHQCTLCRFRYQHTYCCTSTNGLRAGTWVCDWCRLLEKEKTFDDKEARAADGACSVLCEGTGGLEFLLMVALNEAQHAARIETSSGDGGSLCSSSIESSKENDLIPGVLEARSCSSEDRISQGEETRPKFSGAIKRVGTSHLQRKLVRCGMQISQKKQKSLLEQQCSSAQLKRSPSLRNAKSGVAYDPPKSCVRRYKSLSEIFHSSYAGTLPSF